MPGVLLSGAATEAAAAAAVAVTAVASVGSGYISSSGRAGPVGYRLEVSETPLLPLLLL